MALDQQPENVTELEQTESISTENAPTEPAPIEPAPVEPAPAEPAPVEPAPAEPAPAVNPGQTGESTESYFEALKRLEDEKENERKKKKKKKRIVILSVLAAIVLLFTFSSIHKKNALTDGEKTAVKSLVSSINSLPDKISEKDESQIAALNKQYDSLNEKQQKKVKNYKKLTKAEKLVNKEKVQTVEDLIAKIGTVTVDSGDAIQAAKEKYDALPEELKNEVKSYDKLTAAQTSYEKLCAEQVVKLIDGLGEITLESKSKIDEVEEYYGQLSSASKDLVTNYETYTAAKEKYDKLLEAEKARLKAEKLKEFKAALSGFKKTTDSIRGYAWYDVQSMPKYTNIRSYFLPYIATDLKTGNFEALRIKAHYTGSKWLFWNKLTVNIDGENTYIYPPNYSDVKRDNARGDVWETYDFWATDSDIELLRKIAKSKKTIVRFEGDQHLKDVEVTASDKQGIKQMLAAYDIANQTNFSNSLSI